MGGRIGLLEIQPEAAAFAWRGLNPDFALHAFGGFANEGKADAGAFVTLVELLEHTENSILIFLRNPDAVVFKPETDDIAARFRPDTRMRNFTGLNEFDRVGQQIGEALDEARFIGDNGRERFGDLDLHVRRLEVGI